MVCMKVGSKEGVFHLDGRSWLCTTGLPSDVCFQVGEISFHLHKFPLLSKCQLLEKLVLDLSERQKKDETTNCTLSLQDLPGGAESFLLIAQFCYGVKIEFTAENVVSLRCASEYLQMIEDCEEGNLISQTESFLREVLTNWGDTIEALETCEAALPLSEELHIISRCIDSLATKACSDPTLLRSSTSGQGATQSPSGTTLWNRIHSSSSTCSPSEDWWYEDVSILKLPLFKRLILVVGSKGMSPNRIAGCIMFYAKRYLPLNGRKSGAHQKRIGSIVPNLSDEEQRAFIEEIIELLPNQKGATPTKFLLKILRISIILRANPSCQEALERRIGAQLEEASLQDLLIPNTADSPETLYDVECAQRIVDHFLDLNQDDADSYLQSVVEDQLEEVEGSHPFSSTKVVANLLDDYLAEVASDVNLTMDKFVLLASAIPEYVRQFDDGIYRAIDIYLKAHPWLIESEREYLCRLMNCQKLSIEASTHAAQNVMLPLRVTVQVLFFEQVRLRTCVAGWYFVSNNLEQSQDFSRNAGPRNERSVPVKSKGDDIIKFDEMKERVSDLEKECNDMKHEIETLVKTKRSWIINFYKRFGLKVRTKSFDLKSAVLNCSGEALEPSKKSVSDRK